MLIEHSMSKVQLFYFLKYSLKSFAYRGGKGGNNVAYIDKVKLFIKAQTCVYFKTYQEWEGKLVKQVFKWSLFEDGH